MTLQYQIDKTETLKKNEKLEQIERELMGDVCGIVVEKVAGVDSSRVAEAFAIRDGLKLGIALHLTRISIESDAEAIVKNCF